MKIHHVGYVVANIEKYEKHLQYDKKIATVIDPIQQAKLSLYATENIFLELIQPLEESAFTFKALKKNGDHYHHLCYEIESLDNLTDLLKERKMVKVLGPVDAPLFDRQVVFAIDKNKQLVEFVI